MATSEMRSIVFRRADMFYVVEYPSDYTDWQAEADRNPGTVRIETLSGGKLWPPDPQAVDRATRPTEEQP